MGLLGVGIPSCSNHLVQNLSSNSLSSKATTPCIPPSLSSFSINATSSSCSCNASKCMGRRRVISISFVGFLFMSKAVAEAEAEAETGLELERYNDAKEGYTLLVPSSWMKVDKAGATALFEDANKKANNVGVVVAPTRISTLAQFGTPQFVVDKLIQAEKRKESTKEAEVVSVSERSGHGGLQVYEFEYKVDSTRGGPKRVFSAAFVASKKLYLLNITNLDSVENPLDAKRRNILEEVLHSFDAIPSS